MKNWLLFFVLFVILTGCSTNRFIISSDQKQKLEVKLNGIVRGTLDGNETIEINIPQSSIDGYLVSANQFNENDALFYGEIEYGRDSTSTIDIVNSTNCREIKKEQSTDDVIIRYIRFASNNDIQIFSPNTNGYLKLTSNQKDVDIYVDDELVGEIVDEKPFNKKIPSGKHIIMAKKEFFMPYTIEANINEKDIFPFHFELQNVQGWVEDTPGTSTIRQARGNLTIATEKNDYKIYIEGYEKIPPFELKDMPAGMYSLRIVRPGFEKIITVSVGDGEDKFVDLDELLSEQNK